MRRSITHTMPDLSSLPPEAIAVLVRPFLEDVDMVYLIECCGRVYVGRFPADVCRTCNGKPKCIEVRSSDIKSPSSSVQG